MNIPELEIAASKFSSKKFGAVMLGIWFISQIPIPTEPPWVYAAGIITKMVCIAVIVVTEVCVQARLDKQANGES